MEISFPHIEIHVRALEPVEFLIAVDGKTIRAAIDWSILKQLVGADSVNEQNVRDLIRLNRVGFELAMKAHLFARGVPLTRQFSVTLDELRNSLPTSAAANAELP